MKFMFKSDIGELLPITNPNVAAILCATLKLRKSVSEASEAVAHLPLCLAVNQTDWAAALSANCQKISTNEKQFLQNENRQSFTI